MMTRQFNKPPLTYADQIRQLADRGLVIPDHISAEAFITRVNYYRFSGYCLPFEVSRHVFRQETQFDHIRALHDFDHRLRLVLQEALSWVEVGLKTHVAYILAHRGGAFAHVDLKNFQTSFQHSGWRANVREEVERSRETFVEHFRKTYTEFPDLPIWAEVEIHSFGSFSRMFKGLNMSLQTDIARHLGIAGPVLASWLHTLVYIRNLCAHNARCWNRELAIKPAIPKKDTSWQMTAINQSRMYVIFRILMHFFSQSLFRSLDLTEWHQAIRQLQDTKMIGDLELWPRMGFSSTDALFMAASEPPNDTNLIKADTKLRGLS
ncbi:MAG: Abi family protein [Candidatus Riflebacteria bacterium]|nr:Abi family protein [Candidatus Riflebacteria bacterium]